MEDVFVQARHSFYDFPNDNGGSMPHTQVIIRSGAVQGNGAAAVGDTMMKRITQVSLNEAESIRATQKRL